MYDEQVREFQMKLTKAFKPERVIIFSKKFEKWRGTLICFEIQRGYNKLPVKGEVPARLLSSSRQVELGVRMIMNALPISWRA